MSKICIQCNYSLNTSDFYSHDSRCKRCVSDNNRNNKAIKQRTVLNRRSNFDKKGNGIDVFFGANGENILVDNDIYTKYSDKFITLNKTSYPRVLIDGKLHFLHRIVINAKKEDIVDHIDGNPLNSRRCNLRICSSSQNNSHKTILQSNNSSGKTGVFYGKHVNKWIAQLKINKKTKHLGCFEYIEDAIRVRKEAEEKYFGEFKPIV